MTRNNPLGKIVRIAAVIAALLMVTTLMAATVVAVTDTCDDVIGDFDPQCVDGDDDVHLAREVPGGGGKVMDGYIPTPAEECSADAD